MAIVRGSASDYQTRHPEPAAVAVVIEVANTSLLRDQHDKTRIYARASIPTYWIVNLVDQRIEVFTQLSGPTKIPSYGCYKLFQPGDLVPIVLDGTEITSVAVTDLLP